MIMIVVYLVAALLYLRLLHRIYYFLIGHKQLLTFSPRLRMSKIFERSNVVVSEHEFWGNDGILLKYRKIGKGSKCILLANGVGTDFFMWSMFLDSILKKSPDFFLDYTIVATTYRGLFGSDPRSGDDSKISMLKCASDIREVMKKENIKRFHSIIGWSTGAQVALECCAMTPDVSETLILLNPSTGSTLHTSMQPFHPLPKVVGGVISSVVISALLYLKSLCNSSIWIILKNVAFSPFFRIILECSAFFGGFPPEQGAYFHEYMRDVFSSRNHTRGLLDLIVSLDEPASPSALSLPHRTLILSGYPDFLTGIYHAKKLASSMKNSRHICYSMGSHWMLLEWPDLLAKDVLRFLYSDQS